MNYDFKNCTLCPRACGADRETGVGFCGVSEKIKIARAALHMWEEPCISGKNGSGTIFFSGCPLHCVFCQNDVISCGDRGKEISEERLRQICFELKSKGAHNINLVTPMHFAPRIRAALLPIKKELALPIVVNTGGYDSLKQLSCFEGLADIYLPDFKFSSPDLAALASHAPDYPQVCEEALVEMLRQVGPPVFDSQGILQKGLVIRHLILPSHRKDSIAALYRLAALFSPDQFLISLMSQFSPRQDAAPPFHRSITTFEQQSVLQIAKDLGFVGYFQDRASASNDYIPPFDLTGVAPDTPLAQGLGTSG